MPGCTAVTANERVFLPDLTPVGQRVSLWVKRIPERLRSAGHVTWHHVKKAPRYVRYAADYATDPEKNSVVPSLIVFYVLCFLDGYYNAFAAKVPTQALEQSLEHHQYRVFIWIVMVAPLLTLGGMALRGSWAWTGAIMQLCGDIGVAGIITTYLVAVGYTQFWGQGNFSTTWVVAAGIGSYVFIIRDIRRLTDNDRWEVIR